MSLHAAAPVAALWRRSAAYIVDSLIIGIAYILLAVFFDAVFGQLVEATPDGDAETPRGTTSEEAALMQSRRNLRGRATGIAPDHLAGTR